MQSFCKILIKICFIYFLFFIFFIELDPKYAEALFYKGLVLYNLERYDEALEAFNRAIKANPEYVDAWYSKGVILEIRKEYEEALEAYNKAIKLDPDNAVIWDSKGAVLHRLKRYDEALGAFKQAIKIFNQADKPIQEKALPYANLGELFLPYANLGELFLIHGDFWNAQKNVEKSLEIDRENSLALLIKGRIEIENGKYDRAIKFFEDAIFSNLGDPTPLLWTAYAKYLKAESSFEPEDKAYKEEIFSIIRELERAKALSEEYIREELHACILYFLGYFYYKNGDIFTAKEKLIECIKLQSSIEEFINFIKSKLKKEKFGESIRLKSSIKGRACELLNTIWRYKIKPSWWDWWLSSPFYCWIKRIAFFLFLLPIFLLLLRLFIPASFWVSQFLKYIPLISKDNLLVYTAVTSLLLLFILFPSIEKIKAQEVEMELGSPPDFEVFLSPPTMEELL
ncbi:MAG: tetratricopeptide repeat protein [Candidatus Methanofastidiosia archaeon]|jgi:tetratricopeptide (TPR) repeat protein